MNINQIASILGCTVGTIKSRLFYSKKKLKQILDKENINYEDENMRILCMKLNEAIKSLYETEDASLT